MDVIIPLALLVVGLIIGFFVARYIYTKSSSQQAVEIAEKNVKELMAQQADHHIHQTRQSLSAIESQCQTLRQQVEEYEALLGPNADEDTPGVPFYGEQASSYLRNNLQGKEKAKPAHVADTQPRDFAKEGSGLFVGGNSQPAADKKG
ncbi:ZapG family protein [Alteromonas halophila]|uniref:DUF1043 family protein n=1 Tax=Alteromonas halophila TaxID=516698 RepID=A0A918MWH8_9ALTE|nr:DUF1043 family protein [Alteromonas halophila]GGW81113.1 hypothetical protein GCM10007391_12790 [Alteromonas halophila]